MPHSGETASEATQEHIVDLVKQKGYTVALGLQTQLQLNFHAAEIKGHSEDSVVDAAGKMPCVKIVSPKKSSPLIVVRNIPNFREADLVGGVDDDTLQYPCITCMFGLALCSNTTQIPRCKAYFPLRELARAE